MKVSLEDKEKIYTEWYSNVMANLVEDFIKNMKSILKNI